MSHVERARRLMAGHRAYISLVLDGMRLTTGDVGVDHGPFKPGGPVRQRCTAGRGNTSDMPGRRYPEPGPPCTANTILRAAA